MTASDGPYISKSLPEYEHDRQHIEQLVQQWQQRLRLQDWTILVEVVSHADMQDSFNAAQTEVFFPKMFARMRFQPLATIGGDMFPPITDYEVAVVHELLHIPLHRLYPSKEDHPARHYEDDFESGIERIAIALVTASRAAASAERDAQYRAKQYDKLAQHAGPRIVASMLHSDIDELAANSPLSVNAEAFMRPERGVVSPDPTQPEPAAVNNNWGDARPSGNAHPSSAPGTIY